MRRTWWIAAGLFTVASMVAGASRGLGRGESSDLLGVVALGIAYLAGRWYGQREERARVTPKETK